MAAGYSQTPLLRKLGIKAGMRLFTLNAPTHYRDLLGPLPENAVWREAPEPASLDFVHAFFLEEDELEQEIAWLKSLLNPKGMLWLSWPKKSSKIISGLQREPVREIGLNAGLVDIKVCAVDEDWSGLKFVYRRVMSEE